MSRRMAQRILAFAMGMACYYVAAESPLALGAQVLLMVMLGGIWAVGEALFLGD